MAGIIVFSSQDQCRKTTSCIEIDFFSHMQRSNDLSGSYLPPNIPQFTEWGKVILGFLTFERASCKRAVPEKYFKGI